ncbi:MAG: MetQ/NlpA family ABC transporter substrate-binding protein [Lachnospiraceae bacterium]|nr:MetQ/NlpA family ABC transporter substrate-binding protein [Ruminococcus sp.]MCM1275048.1 MetQ/NlpA family ABC transporter substrate-binding protein [Lachnospiraceae bacterium]
MKKICKFAALAAAAALIFTAFTGCSKSNESEVVKLGVTGAVYEELWRPTIEKLADEGVTVELVQFSDFSLPNNALNSGDIQMNAFQHHAYFDNDTATNGYDISILGDTFVIAMNIFSKNYTSVEEIPEGGKIAVPNDATNYGRALILLRDAGLLTLGDYEGGTPSTTDITSSKVELVEVNANMTYQYVDDSEIAAAVVNGNYAASYGVDPNTAIFYENVDLSNKSFVCVIAVRTADINNETCKKVAEAFCSADTEKFFEDNYKGFFIPAWNA